MVEVTWHGFAASLGLHIGLQQLYGRQPRQACSCKKHRVARIPAAVAVRRPVAAAAGLRTRVYQPQACAILP